MHENRNNIYLVGESLDVTFDWDLYHVLLFEELWDEGVSLPMIAEMFERPMLDCLFLLLDRAEQGKVNQRAKGVW